MQIIHLICAKTWGGGERYALDLCRASKSAGYDVDIFSRGVGIVDSPFQDAGIATHFAPLKGVPDIVSPWKVAQWILKNENHDFIIHVHNFKDATTAIRARRIVGKRKNVKIVCTRHLAKPANVSRRWNRLYNNLDLLILISDYVKSRFLSSGPKVADTKMEVVHNSIQLPAKYSAPQITRHSNHGNLRLLYVGRISPEKGIESLIKGLKIVNNPSLRLIITGTGDSKYIMQLRSLAKEEGVAAQIVWKGFVDDVFAEINNSDICIFPSKWGEPFGLTIIDAMSQSRPVITTDNGAQPEIITSGKDGVLVPPENPGKIAEAILMLSADEPMRIEMGKQARATYMERFSYDRFFKEIDSIYQTLIPQSNESQQAL